MKIVIAGGSGLVGTALRSALKERSHEVYILSRSQRDSSDTIHWDPSQHSIDLSQLEGVDVCINLAGENIAARLWSKKQRNLIQQSRIQSTSTLVSAFSKLSNPPKSFISASAVGYYGYCQDELVDEDSPLGSGFLAETTALWEAEAQKAAALTIRTAICRFGVILSPNGGALAKMLPIFKLGLGGPLGSGKQFMSWISLEDAVGAVIFLIENNNCAGIYNVVSPGVATNYQFTKELGKALRRPTIFAVPECVLKLVAGKMAEELFLFSSKVSPKRLLQEQFSFKHKTLAQFFYQLYK